MTSLDWPELRHAAVGWALQHGAGDDAEDVAQEALIRLLRAGGEYPGAAAFAAVHQAVRWIMTDRAKSTHGRASHCLLSPTVPAPPHHRDPLEPWLALAQDAQERASVAAIAHGLLSSDQVALWPALFGSANEVYRARKRLVERLRRHPEELPI